MKVVWGIVVITSFVAHCFFFFLLFFSFIFVFFLFVCLFQGRGGAVVFVCECLAVVWLFDMRYSAKSCRVTHSALSLCKNTLQTSLWLVAYLYTPSILIISASWTCVSLSDHLCVLLVHDVQCV